MAEQNTAWLLAQWALWQREGVGLKLSAKSPLAFLSQVADEELEIASSEICDEDALRVDRVMAELKSLSKEYYKTLVYSFVNNLSAGQVALRMGVSRYMAVKLYEEAYQKVDELLSRYSDSLDCKKNI